jgi:hypothetical protein
LCSLRTEKPRKASVTTPRTSVWRMRTLRWCCLVFLTRCLCLLRRRASSSHVTVFKVERQSVSRLKTQVATLGARSRQREREGGGCVCAPAMLRALIDSGALEYGCNKCVCWRNRFQVTRPLAAGHPPAGPSDLEMSVVRDRNSGRLHASLGCMLD